MIFKSNRLHQLIYNFSKKSLSWIGTSFTQLGDLISQKGRGWKSFCDPELSIVDLL